MNDLFNNHLTQCASVYMFVNKDNVDFYVVHCLFCNEEYSNWTKFLCHVHDHHLHKSHQSNHDVINGDDDIKVEYLDEEFQLDISEDIFGNCDAKSEYLENDYSFKSKILEKSESLAYHEFSEDSHYLGKQNTNKQNNSTTDDNDKQNAKVRQ